MNDNGKNRTTVTAPDIVCEGCATAIKKALERVDGVGSVDVDVAAKRVAVEHGANVGRGDIISALDKAGFPAE